MASIGLLHRFGILHDKETSMPETGESLDSNNTNTPPPLHARDSWLSCITGFIDVRILLIGSLLPDIIDKPVGVYLFPDIFSSGRIFSHSMLFALIITLASILLYRMKHATWLMALSIGVWMHLVLDEMWLAPRTLFWPTFGVAFDAAYLENWLYTIFYRMFHEPRVFIPEIVGILVCIWFIILLIRNRKVLTFLRRGSF